MYRREPENHRRKVFWPKKYRNLTRMIDDRETAQRTMELTAELKQRALALARPDEAHIRIRAREIWEENGRPSGRDQEFWYQAEREFREAEELAMQDEIPDCVQAEKRIHRRHATWWCDEKVEAALDGA